jgi:pyruvate kinase
MGRRAKILCTIGPASASPEVLGAMIDAGMNAARLNFSHGTHEDMASTFKLVVECATDRRVPIAVLADLQGPKIRVGRIPDPGYPIEEGDEVVLTVADVECSPDRIPVDYPALAREVGIGDPILMDDGALELQVERVDGDDVITRVVVGGVLESRKGVNLPKTELSLPSMTDKDVADLRFALELGVDFVALSFVRSAEDLDAAYAVMDEVGHRVPLIAKIEKPEAIENLDTIIRKAKGIMVARGDLGVEMGPERVPLIQKQTIERTNQVGKLVITATQMLDSMIRNPRPTRAEASDVANAIFDGSDAVMLSGETATGKYPVRAVETMDRIIRAAEQAPRHWHDPPADMALQHSANAVARATVASARVLDDIKAIVVYTGSGGTARLIAEYRPEIPIYAFTPDRNTRHGLALNWGITPFVFETHGTDHVFADLDQALLRAGLIKRGERVAIALGWPLEANTSANMLKLHVVGSALPEPG